jgi:membrane protein implicated in regulation of membrane protease activity
MNFLSALIDSIIDFVRRNPLMTTLIIMLMVFAPSAFGVLFIGIMVVLLLLLAIPIFLLFRLRRASRHIEDEARRASQQARGQQFYGGQTYGQQSRKQEGEVKVYTTSQQPQKRVNDNVGDYVDFEEVKEKK